MNKKRLIISSVISIFLVSILLLGSTYSIFTSQEIDENENVYKTGNLNITYKVSSNTIHFTDSTPMTIEEADAVIPYRVTVTNSGNVPYEFDVILLDTTSSEENTIDYQYIMTKVGYLDPIALSNCTNNIIKENVIVPAGSSVDIDIRLWLDSTLPNTEIGKSFYAKLKIDGLAVYNDDEDIDNSKLSLRYMKTSSANDFRNDAYRTYITNASFVDYIDTTNASINTESNEKIMWDMSTSQDKSVIAWLEDNGGVDESGSKLYNLYIGASEKIYAKNLQSFFESMSAVEAIYFDNFDTSLTTSMSGGPGWAYGGMFDGCISLIELDVSNWDISNVERMNRLFCNCSSLTNLDVGNWDTSNVIGMYAVFENCKFLTEIELNNWNTSKVTNMSRLFRGCISLINLEIGNFDTSNVISIDYMFMECKLLTEIDLCNWNTSNVATMYGTFHSCKNLAKIDLSGWNTSDVTNMCMMFYNCTQIIYLDLSNFDTSNVTDMLCMFDGCSSAEEIVFGENFDTSKVTRISNMFFNCSNLKKVDVSGFDLSSTTSLSNIFYNCRNLTSLDISNWHTSNIIDMSNLFYNCINLQNLNLSSWDTSNVTNMNSMFYKCTQLTTNITVKNPNTNYNNIFNGIGTNANTSITLYYVGDNPSTTDINESTESLVISMIGSNSKVINGGCVGDYCSV